MTTVTTPREGPSVGAPAPPAFLQKLGLFDATMLVAGTMIGSGIFIVSSEIARDVGATGWLLVAWVLTGVMTIIGALSYAELAAMMPHAGGQYVYLREAYSPLWGFLYGWTVFLVIQTGSIAAVGVAFAKFLGVLVPILGTDEKAGALVLFQLQTGPYTSSYYLPWSTQPPTLFTGDRFTFTITAGQGIAVIIVALLTVLNCLGVREGKWVQNLFTVAKTLALLALIALGLTVAQDPQAIAANTAELWKGAVGTEAYTKLTASEWFDKLFGSQAIGPPLAILMVLGGAMVGSLFAADAWNNVTFTAGEVKNPRRNLPLSLLLGTGMVIILYLLANVAYLAALPLHGDVKKAEQLEAQARQLESSNPDKASTLRAEAAYARGIDQAKDDRVGTAILERVSPVLGVSFMAIAVMISTFGCINGMVLMGARLYYAMAQDGLFFQAVGQLTHRGVPTAGLILQGLWSILLIFSGTYSQLLDYVIFAVLLFYVLTVVGLFVLRRTQPHLERPYKAFGYPFIPGLYVFLCAVIMLDLLVVKPEYTWPGLIIVLTGIPVYFLWRLSARLTGPS
jgi:APA family basic amino acid/polyamine antiporter